MSARAQDALTQEQLEAMLDAVDTRSPSGKRNLALVTLLGDLGLRVGEALALETRDLVTEAGQLTEIKLRSRKRKAQGQSMPLPRRTAVRLAKWLQAREKLGLGAGAVFCTISEGTRVHPTQDGEGFSAEMTTTALQPGKPLSDSYVRQLVARLAQRAEIDQRVTPHTLRHTLATILLRAGANLKVVQETLGHASIDTTARIYSHVTSNDVRNALEKLHDREGE